jgi:hypothetical protein
LATDPPTEPPLIHLILKPLPADAPVAIRLRRLLKVALRAFGLRCVAVEEVSGKAMQGEQGPTDGAIGKRQEQRWNTEGITE